MWETTNLEVFPNIRNRHMECSSLPHLAKNERDMGHPTILGREKKTQAQWRDLLWLGMAYTNPVPL
jgi:hypothetical protein